MAEGREGDWECGGCLNRNYAFRSFCNRCKQPRLLVDIKTPSDSKWLPRIGDWICSGCSNNNYASREKCKKCGQPKEIAAIPATAMPGASLQTYAHYFARAQGARELKMTATTNPNWSYGGWRSGDWICICGFHNYSSRAQCKKCNAHMPPGGPSAERCAAIPDFIPALGTKRVASDELACDWDKKRLNVMNDHFQMARTSSNQTSSVFPAYSFGSMDTHTPQLVRMPVLIGKGCQTYCRSGDCQELLLVLHICRAKQWRDGDWMCTNCNNHNFASRSHCNRCKTQKDPPNQPLSVA